MIYQRPSLPVDNFCTVLPVWGITGTMTETRQQSEADGTVLDSAPSLAGFRRGRQLGTGGSASVWLMTSEQEGRQYAAKVFTPDGDSVTASQLRREMELLERLDHEHLVRLRDVFEADDGIILLMDYAAGGSLAALVGARGPLPVEEVVTILTPVARCLSYLHSHGVAHSDVAPGNVLFTEHGKPLLADLGFSRMTGEGGTGTAGTAGFSAAGTDNAEHGRLRPDEDIYGLAALGWYALTGRVPASGDRRPPLPVVVPSVPEELALIIEAGLQPSAQQRPSATEFEQAVFRSAQAAPVNLVPAVHESVLPHLLTRRNVMEQERQSGRKRIKFGSGKLRGRMDKRVRRRRRKRGADAGTRMRMMTAGGIFLAAVIAAGALLAGGDAEPAVLSETPPSGTAATAGPSGKTTSPAATTPASGRSHTPSSLPDGVRDKLTSTDPRQAVRALARLRSYAFSSGRTQLLELVNVPGSPAMSADRSIEERIERTGHVFAGFETRISAVERLRAPEHGGNQESGGSDGARSETVFMAVTASSDGFVERDKNGKVVSHHRQDQQQRLVLKLRRIDGQWLIDNVLAPQADG